jgi:hypothetical protein
MKHRLLKHFGENIIITDINGKCNVVTFRTTATALLQQFFNTPKAENTEGEKIRNCSQINQE